jgi:inositol-pentakisphosphate 2-kinase
MSSTNPSSSIPVSQFQFPPGNDYEFKFVAEGAANLVFEVVVPPKDDNGSSIFDGENPIPIPQYRPASDTRKGNLLRVPKAGTKAHPHEELQVYWETVVKPLFNPEDLVQHQLIRLEGNEVVSRLNAVLAQEDATRRVDFRGTRVAEAEYGMLIEDMRQSMPTPFLGPLYFNPHSPPPQDSPTTSP